MTAYWLKTSTNCDMQKRMDNSYWRRKYHDYFVIGLNFVMQSTFRHSCRLHFTIAFTPGTRSNDQGRMSAPAELLKQSEDLAQWIEGSLWNWVSPFVVVMRGISGSGKSTFARELDLCVRRRGLTCAIVSADRFFEGSHGGYFFDRVRLSEAHQQCRDNFVAAATDVVVVDNTNICASEYKFYMDEVERRNLCSIFVHMDCHDEDFDACLERAHAAGRMIPERIQRNKLQDFWQECPPSGIHVSTSRLMEGWESQVAPRVGSQVAP